jgi:alpha-tubulin suppressor-like RCC1 family protein
VDRYEPTLINIFPKSIKEISCGDSHTLVLDSDGAFFSFGGNGVLFKLI